MRLLGHRGASASAPENTLPAFEAALRQGADGIELDVMTCGTGEVVVCHDERLGRLAGVDWEVRWTSWERLRRLDVGSRLGFAPAHVPLLDEVLELVPRGDFLVNVELKCERVEDDGLTVKAAERVLAHGLEDQVVFSSFNPLCLVRLARAHPRLRRGFLVDPDRGLFLQEALWTPLGANFAIHPPASLVTAARVRAWHARGWEVAAWTVDEAAEAARLRDAGVDTCITNRPGALRAELGGA
jgi:glycerophosphoryl diester phosphodiesterase